MTNKSYRMTDDILKDAFAHLSGSKGLKVINANSPDYICDEKKYYTVRRGDTLSLIAVENDTTVSILCQLNKMNKTDKLRTGRRIRVK